ncbi:MAG: glycosyltransferase, partial [Planctomycetes bacterium]|nr:glycosyltransferase [Planctomycetota bacterium]
MRILLLTPFLPDPAASHGGGSYVGALADGLRAHAELGLVHLSHGDERDAAGSGWSWRQEAPYQGRPDGMAHRLRMLWRWRDRPLLAAKYWQPRIPALLQRAIAEFTPDAALVEMAQMAQYLPFLQGLPTVFTDHEAGRPANAGTGLGALADRRDARLWERYVGRRYRTADLVQAVTEEDAGALTSRLGTQVAVRPATLPVPAQACSPGAAPACALFLGDYRHQPNPEAAARLAREVWPRVRRLHPDAELLLAGPHEGAIRHLGELDGVRVLGFVPDLDALLGGVRLVLAPLWSGGGFRVKNATALLHGLPVVTNALGARGCRAPEPACVVREDEQGLADAACALLASPERAADAGRQAREWAVAQFAADAVARLQIERL